MKIKAKLVDNWKDVWKWYSTNALVIAALLNAAQELLPLFSQLLVLDAVSVGRASAALAIVAIIGRLVDQTKNAPPAT